MYNKSVISVLVLCASLVACADLKNELSGTAKPDAGITEEVPQTKNFSAPFERTWQAALAILDEHNILYEADKSAGKIVTEDKALQNISGWRAAFYGSNYKAKQFIDVKPAGDTNTAVQFRARFTKEFVTVFATTNKEYPEAENLLRKTFFGELDTRLGAGTSKADPKSESMTTLEVQKRLLDLDYQPGTPDGVMGRRTVDALKKFQQDNNLLVTGRPDRETVSALRVASKE